MPTVDWDPARRALWQHHGVATRFVYKKRFCWLPTFLRDPGWKTPLGGEWQSICWLRSVVWVYEEPLSNHDDVWNSLPARYAIMLPETAMLFRLTN